MMKNYLCFLILMITIFSCKKTTTNPISPPSPPQPAITSTTITSLLNPATFGQSVTFTATITAASGSLTGTVSFYDGTTLLGIGTLLSNTATYSTSLLIVGSHNITATYAGNASYLASTSSVLLQIVNAPDDIYVAGLENQQVVYWKNGNRTMLGFTGTSNSAAHGIAASDTNVYVVGNWDAIGFTAMLWKNSIPTQLTNGTSSAGANAITIDNNNIYIAGFEFGANSNSIIYWKNGIKNIVASTPKAPDGNAIAVSGNDIYIAGTLSDGTYTEADYWKNGVKTTLVSNGNASSIYISGSDVYVAGNDVFKAVYWKNGIETVLSAQSSKAEAIIVSGSDTYVVGSVDYQKAVYWKNGVMKILDQTSATTAAITSIAIKGSDIYMAGYVGDIAVYWKNDIKTTLSVPGPSPSKANAIFVVKH